VLAVGFSSNTCNRAAALLKSFWRWDRAAVVRAAFRNPITAAYLPDPPGQPDRRLNAHLVLLGNLDPEPTQICGERMEAGLNTTSRMGRRAASRVGLLAQRAILADSASGVAENPRHREQIARSLSYLGASTSLPAGRGGALYDVAAMRSAGPAGVLSRGKALAARQEVDTAGPLFRMQGMPRISVSIDGAVSMVCDDGPAPSMFQNKDGHRLEDGRYAAFAAEITGFIPAERQYTDPVRTFAYGTDASFYRLNPKLVVKVSSVAARVPCKHTASVALHQCIQLCRYRRRMSG